jgi:hypothetical protein
VHLVYSLSKTKQMVKAKEFHDKRVLFVTGGKNIACYCYMSSDPEQTSKVTKDFDMCETQSYFAKIFRSADGRLFARFLLKCDFKMKTITDAGLQAILPGAFRKWHASLKLHLAEKTRTIVC